MCYGQCYHGGQPDLVSQEGKVVRRTMSRERAGARQITPRATRRKMHSRTTEGWGISMRIASGSVGSWAELRLKITSGTPLPPPPPPDDPTLLFKNRWYLFHEEFTSNEPLRSLPRSVSARCRRGHVRNQTMAQAFSHLSLQPSPQWPVSRLAPSLHSQCCSLRDSLSRTVASLIALR